MEKISTIYQNGWRKTLKNRQIANNIRIEICFELLVVAEEGFFRFVLLSSLFEFMYVLRSGVRH